MSGTQTGGFHAASTNKTKYGSDYYAKIGAIGGLAKVPKGFAVTGNASEAGRKGGTISKRGPKKITHKDISLWKKFKEKLLWHKITK